MKFIAHRGLLYGPSSINENLPAQIDLALNQGFDAEVDVWYLEESKEWWLGHDIPQYQIDYQWLNYRKFELWVHCKNVSALYSLRRSYIRHFWHQNDDYTLTSDGIIWCYPGKRVPSNGIMVLPEHHYATDDIAKMIADNDGWYGVCTDYTNAIRQKVLDIVDKK